jgi:xylan 1,4-beta-xylosidase
VEFPSPLLPGFNPDPSVVKVGSDYYLTTSTFEYLPALPIYHSVDFVAWRQIGAVATRPETLGINTVTSRMGVWAPTIRHHNGIFFVIVTITGGRGCVVFTASNPAGEWSGGITIAGLHGIDPDLAWDEAGTAYVTFSGLVLDDARVVEHRGIQQVRVDLDTGQMLEEPRSIWSGTGLKFPEAPHLYHRDGIWYLLIAEGGTERGHAVSVARSSSPEGPFEGNPANPIFSARSTDRAVQNTGHGDFVELPNGSTGMVYLGMRPGGLTQGFSPLGRETFATTVSWHDGWPSARPATSSDPVTRTEIITFEGATAIDNRWLGVRQAPDDVATLSDGWLLIRGNGSTLSDVRPHFLGRRQENLFATVSAVVDASAGCGGLAIRYDEDHHAEIEVAGGEGSLTVTARVYVSGMIQHRTAEIPPGLVELRLDTVPAEPGFGTGMGPDTIVLSAVSLADPDNVRLQLTADGRYLSAETAAAFTGRVTGLYGVSGTVRFRDFRSAPS